MTFVGWLDAVAAATAAAALAGILLRWQGRFAMEIRVVAGMFIGVNLLRNISNLLEWSGITSRFDIIEDFLELTIPLLWAVLLYALVQKSIQRELRAERANLEGLFNSIHELVFVLNPEGRIQAANPVTRRLLGPGAEGWESRRFDDLFALPSRALAARSLDGSRFSKASTFRGELSIPDGHPLILDIRIAQGEWNGAPAFFAVCRDITEQEAMAERLHHSERLLALGQLAGGIAHDFNNQLMGIMGHAELLQDSLPEDLQEQESIQAILTAASRAADLTSQLLAFARKGKYRSVPTDLNATIREVVSLLERSIDKRIGLELDLCENKLVTMGDPTQLQNALLNIALNARDAMPDGGCIRMVSRVRTLSVNECRESGFDLKPGNFAEIAVSDTGTGMDESVRRRIFEPFFTTKETGKGVGMGMAAVFGTVKIHGGAVDVETRSGEGTTVRLWLPLIEGEADGLEDRSVEPGTGTSPLRVWVVDDEELVRRISVGNLESAGHRVRAFASSREALAQFNLHWHDVDVVVLDLIMPGMDGIQVMEAMRRIDPCVRVILSSGHGDGADSARLRRSGLRVFLAKPYGRRELLAAVAEVADMDIPDC